MTRSYKWALPLDTPLCVYLRPYKNVRTYEYEKMYCYNNTICLHRERHLLQPQHICLENVLKCPKLKIQMTLITHSSNIFETLQFHSFDIHWSLLGTVARADICAIISSSPPRYGYGYYSTQQQVLLSDFALCQCLISPRKFMSSCM